MLTTLPYQFLQLKWQNLIFEVFLFTVLLIFNVKLFI